MSEHTLLKHVTESGHVLIKITHIKENTADLTNLKVRMSTNYFVHVAGFF